MTGVLSAQDFEIIGRWKEGCLKRGNTTYDEQVNGMSFVSSLACCGFLPSGQMHVNCSEILLLSTMISTLPLFIRIQQWQYPPRMIEPKRSASTCGTAGHQDHPSRKAVIGLILDARRAGK
jgi:hypothetical protein